MNKRDNVLLLLRAIPGDSMKRILFVSAVLYCSCLYAGPAAWYKWHSADNGFDICSQISPGDGWVPVKGPFEDASCKKLGAPI